MFLKFFMVTHFSIGSHLFIFLLVSMMQAFCL